MSTTKKIGILHGMEETFPQAFIDRINEKGESGITAERVYIDKVMQGEPMDYAVIVDRISQDVPFYRSMLKNAASTGTAVINNPFWWSADEKFFNNALALKIGVPVPKTVLLPSRDRPEGTSETSFRNLAMPLDWEGIFNYVGFPAYMKPHDGGGWKNVYKLHDADDFFHKFQETERHVMMLQEEIIFQEYFRCYCIGGRHVRIMQYEPRNPHHLRYEVGGGPVAQQLLDTVRDYVIRLNEHLGYDFNTVEFAVRDGVPYAIDFCNPAPDADVHSVGQENFEWVVETAANYAIERAKAQRPGQDNLTWGAFVRHAANASRAQQQSAQPDVSVAAPQEMPQQLPDSSIHEQSQMQSSGAEESAGSNATVTGEAPTKAATKTASKAPKKVARKNSK